MALDVNIPETYRGAVTERLPTLRRHLIAKRVEHGADTPVGHRCSNLVGQLENLQAATDRGQRQALEEAISKQMAELEKLTAVGRQGE